MNDSLTYEDLKRVFDQLKPLEDVYVIEPFPEQLYQVKVPHNPERCYRGGSILITTDATENRIRDGLLAIEPMSSPALTPALGYLFRVSGEEAREFLAECLKEIMPLLTFTEPLRYKEV